MDFIKSTINSALDPVKSSVKQFVDVKVLGFIEPRLRKEVDEEVDEFRESSLQQIPRQAEDALVSNKDNSTLTWFLHKVLNDDTDVLVARLVEKLRPQIERLSDGVTNSVVGLTMDKTRDFLHLDDDQADQVKSRGLPSEEDDSDGFSFGGAVSGVLNMDSKLPALLRTVTEGTHPIFQDMKPAIWAAVPGALEWVTAQLFEEKKEAYKERSEEEDAGFDLQDIAEFGGQMKGWITEEIGDLVNKLLPTLLQYLEAPTKETISQLVDTLEQAASTTCENWVKTSLQKFHLIGAEQ